MNILMYGWELPPENSGGLGVACYGLTRALSELGIDIDFILPRKLSSRVQFMKIWDTRLPGNRINALAVNSLLMAYSTNTEYQDWLVKLDKEEQPPRIWGNNLVAEALRYGEIAGKWARKLPHNVIHVHDWMTYPAGMTAKLNSGKPLVAHVHATEFDRCAADLVNQQVAEIEYQGLQAADKVITVSGYTKQKVIDKYAVNSGKVEVVHNGVEADEFPFIFLRQLLPGYQTVLFVGRLTIQKGADYLLKAAVKVLAKKPKTVFIFVGDGDMKQQLIMKAAQLGVAHRVFFPGFVRDRIRLAHLYQAADVFVMPSVSEPFGIVPLEALANHKPVIISKQSGVAEVVNHVFKVDFWDVDRLTELIIACLHWPELRSEMSKNGYHEVKELTWDRAAEKMMEVYKCLISNY
jgi:glycosyltransferase involved in cell wall biosynthesis